MSLESHSSPNPVVALHSSLLVVHVSEQSVRPPVSLSLSRSATLRPALPRISLQLVESDREEGPNSSFYHRSDSLPSPSLLHHQNPAVMCPSQAYGLLLVHR